MDKPTNDNISYYNQRITEDLGVSAEENKILIKGSPGQKNEMPIFSEDQDGNIRILVYSLNRELITYDHPKATPEKPSIYNNRDQTYCITRLKQPVTDRNGKIKKYHIPKGAGTYPFFHPSLIEKYENKIPIKTLTLTEGFFKAYNGCKHGIDVIGLSSITHYRDKDTRALHPDILKLIKTCQAENIILLYDGDCLDISCDALQNLEDLYKRPNSFFSSARSIQELLKDHDLNIYFSHILSDAHPDHPKGLDDLLVCMKGEEQEVARDHSLFSRPGKYFIKMDISHSLHKLRRYFHLNSPEDFYSFHAEFIQDKEFVFNGTHYRWEEKENNLNVIVPAAAKDYFRVGDSYYEFVEVPNKYHSLERRFERRLKGTIIDDHGKKFLDHIPKYKSFCNVPDHTNYHQVIDNCFNIYAPFEHEPEEGSCDTTLNFIKHIFQDQMELGLDYLQLLYQKPTQILPILCLVSRENSTGKTTFAKYLKEIFTQNLTIVGNDELSSGFNTTYANKLIIVSEETFLEKKQIIEKIKALATGDKILMNAKGKDHIEIDFFGKFILLSNNEDNFIYASRDDIRYWVIKVPIPDKININILKELTTEIPAFLNFLNHRKYSTSCVSRMWFEPSLLITDALRKVVLNSQPFAEKEIREKIRELFITTGDEEILMSSSVINRIFLKNKYSDSYISSLLKDHFGIDCLKNKQGQYIIKRYEYPQFVQSWENGELVEKLSYIKHRGRAFLFRRNDFINSEEQKNLCYESENEHPYGPDPPF